MIRQTIITAGYRAGFSRCAPGQISCAD